MPHCLLPHCLLALTDASLPATSTNAPATSANAAGVRMCAAGVNTAKSDEVCQQEGRAIVAAYEQRAASWWSLDPSSWWLSMRHLKALLDSEWQAGSCRGPGMQAPARKALEARSQALIKDMSIARLQFVDGSLVGVYAICLLGLVNCGSRLCEGARFEDSHKEARMAGLAPT